MSKKALLILHGKQAANQAVRDAVMDWRDQGHELAVRVTWEAGDAKRYVHEALNNGFTTIIAGGGDGSVRDITQALMESGQKDLELAILPLGTANDFATAAEIPVEPAASLSLLENIPQPCDVIQVNDHYFLNMATGGFGTEVTTQTSEDLKKMLGGAAYLLTGLTRFPEIESAKGHFKGEDFEWEGEFLALGLGNGRQAGGGQRLCPDALINNGLFDVAILPADMDLLAGVKELFDSEARQDPSQEGLFVRTRLSEMHIETPTSMNLNLDGEPIQSTTFRIRAIPNALRLYLPERSPLLG
ncbi:lipid kinase YegS [Alcanivorax sp. HI0083]|uniref:lipid kinase YegS n=1 Tax=unclassified Alcanivorax TaxID=2638842 RepID=UPI0007B812D6|nr:MULTISPECIES: lipid kinase YegS [unclassified Alcanivorax]KZY37103.1 lipid kinase YegS [Alcanivorax sp. HI0044]KZZ24249.1 lipid kinase YegS [Alcanivorax sp. HI0083]